MQATHLMAQRLACRGKPDLQRFEPRLAVSLLRYVDLLPPDSAFYGAAQACKVAGIGNMAFVFFNRFLDVCEAIEDGSLEGLDNSDFVETDIPFDIQLPPEKNVPSERYDEAKEWVLTVSMENSVEQQLTRRTCSRCGSKVYEAALVCPNCREEFESCVVTGYPAMRNRVKCYACGRAANKDDWNAFVLAQKKCSWCLAPQSYSLSSAAKTKRR